MRESIRHALAGLTDNLHDYTSTITHKFITYAGATSAGYNLRGYLPDPIGRAIDAVATFPWMDFLSFIALVLLIVERSFIVWARYREHKRSKESQE